MKRVWLVGLAVALALAAPRAVASQANVANADELRELRAEMQRLRDEVAALRKEVREGRAAPSTATLMNAQYAAPSTTAGAAPGAAPQEPAGPSLEILQAQIAEQAQTKVESNSRFPVRVFGAIATNLYANLPQTLRQNDPEYPSIALATTGSNAPFGVSMRQTRLGAILDGPTIGGMRSSAVVAIDFFSGPRLLYGFARLEGERTAIEVGQDHILFAPQNPTSLAMMAFPQFFHSGNVYLRLPQFRVEHTRPIGENSTWSFAGGVTAPRLVGTAGNTSVYPPLQGRTAWRTRGSESHVEIGASGYYGKVRQAGIREDAWGFALDFDARAGRFGLGGEMFVAQELPQFGLAVGQFARSAGGFIEARWAATPRLDFNAGFGTDRLFQFTAAPALDARDSNTSVFGNFIFRFTPEFETSFEYRWLSTEPLFGTLRPNNHLNLVFVYRF